jgi:lipooligosaccharide transport system permease protein
MVTTLVLPRLAAKAPSRWAPAQRVGAVTSRNFVAVRHHAYWLVVISGFLEPVLYLLSLGVGVGGLIKTFTLADGSVISYSAFVAPAMLAASAMNGALAESTFNFFARLKFVKMYDAMVATPLRPIEVALGELAWALLRGALYSVAFLTLMVALDLTTAGWALAALPASLLVGLAFGAVGMAISTAMRTWQDFDIIVVVQFSLFLFSGTFVPVDAYPAAVRVLVQATPLLQAVELVRDLTTGRPTWSTTAHAGYLVVLAAVALIIAGRRMDRILCR